MPTYGELMLPVLRAVVALGGSGSSREITDQVVRDQSFSEEMLTVCYPTGKEKSVLLDRLDWARSYCKLGDILESPKRGLFLVTDTGRELSELPDDRAVEALKEIDREVRHQRGRTAPGGSETIPEIVGGDQPALAAVDEEDDDGAWRRQLLERLHQLSPAAFERFTLYLLRAYGMELRRQGGPGDEGIDGIGTAPLTDVLTTTVAVQAKRYEPGGTIGREIVALFQSDATAAGAEHGVLVTTARFSEPARKAALGRTPTIDLIDGDRLADLCLRQEVGVVTRPVVRHEWFNRFEDERDR